MCQTAEEKAKVVFLPKEEEALVDSRRKGRADRRNKTKGRMGRKKPARCKVAGSGEERKKVMLAVPSPSRFYVLLGPPLKCSVNAQCSPAL